MSLHVIYKWEITSLKTFLFSRLFYLVRRQTEGHGNQHDVTFHVNEFLAVTKMSSAMLTARNRFPSFAIHNFVVIKILLIVRKQNR